MLVQRDSPQPDVLSKRVWPTNNRIWDTSEASTFRQATSVRKPVSTSIDTSDAGPTTSRIGA